MKITLTLQPSGEVQVSAADQVDDWFHKVVIEVEDALRRAPPPPEPVVVELIKRRA